MAFFGDINFRQMERASLGPLSSLVESQFSTNLLRYPIDLAEDVGKGHYMMIYVRQQVDSSFNNLGSSDAVKTNSAQGNVFRSAPIDVVNMAQNAVDKVQQAVSGSISNVLESSAKEVGSFLGQVYKNTTQTILNNNVSKIGASRKEGTILNALNKTYLTKDAIALYMPDTLMFTNSQTYEQLTPGNDIFGQLAVAAGQSLVGSNRDAINDLVKSAGRLKLQQALGGLGSTGQLGLFAATGTVVNPMLEMIYKSPNFRSFRFDFNFYPRSEAEAMQVQKIIERLRFHQAPELAEASRGGIGLLIPPSEFEIKFYYNGIENPNISKIGLCVLQSIDVNYAPNGFSAYEVLANRVPTVGGTGMPVGITVSLAFQEVTYLTKNDFTGNKENQSFVEDSGSF